jgi:hypothetical protein
MGRGATELRGWLHDARHGNPWRYERVREPVEIWPLVSPLRYDVLVRRAHFEHLAAHRDRYDEDFDAYARDAREHPYFAWFRHIMCPRWQPEVLLSEAALEQAWHRRLRASAALADSFARSGFDERFPITLYAGVRVGPATSGRHVDRVLFAGDGNHRLALLMAAGRTHLEPRHCRVKRFLTLRPADTSPTLAWALGDERFAALRAQAPAPVAA